MTKAEEQLRLADGRKAEVRQGEAVSMLEEALRSLRELAAQTEREIVRRTLAQIREELLTIAESQKPVNSGVEGLRARIVEAGRIGRQEARDASKLVREQSQVHDLVTQLSASFDEVAVYKWSVQRIGGWMIECRDQLDAREINDALVAGVKRILREIERLIAALDETQTMPIDTEFEEIAEGDDGMEPGESARAVPNLAELLVLRTMQADILTRTRLIQQSAAERPEDQQMLEDIKALGEDQTELRRLTEMVARKAMGQ
jgi:hypothetical protein